MVSQAPREREDDGVHFISLVLAMLLCLTRPEAPLFVGLLYIGLWSFDFDWKRSLMPLCAMGLFLGRIDHWQTVLFWRSLTQHILR